MTQFEVIFREQAINDLNEIWLYTVETWSLEQADKYYRQIIEGINSLSKNPQLGKHADQIRNGYRSYKVNSHRIFYVFTDQELDIIRILHAQMDLPNRLLE